MNQCEASNSPPDIGGVAAPSRKRCEATATAQTGWLGVPKCFGMPSLEEVVPFSTTPSAPLKEASRLLLDVASTPPMSGGEWRTRFIHARIRPPEFLHVFCHSLDTEGVAAASMKCRLASLAPQTGWSGKPKCFLVPDHPVRSLKGGFAASFLMSRTPLFEEGSSATRPKTEGNELGVTSDKRNLLRT